MRGLFAVALGAGALALAGAARAAAPPSLATPWPQQTGCSSFSGVDVSVDDRVRAVEWRGPNGASFVIEVTPAADQYNHEAYASGSEGLDCHRDLSSCIVYRGGAKVRNVRVARGSRRVPPDFAPGAYTELVLRDDVRAAPRPRADCGLDFGLRLILHCTDSTKTKSRLALRREGVRTAHLPRQREVSEDAHRRGDEAAERAALSSARRRPLLAAVGVPQRQRLRDVHLSWAPAGLRGGDPECAASLAQRRLRARHGRQLAHGDER